MEQHQFGLREWADLCERKDATIAALQARVRELEAEGVKLFEWRLALHSLTPGGSEFCTPNACEEWVRKHRASQHEYLIEQIVQRKDLQSQLTQRTAELEAAKREVDVWKEKAELRGKEACAQRAELERVRGELAETKEEVKCLDEQVLAMNEWGLTVEKLLLALPKVEGEIAVKETEIDLAVMWGITVNGLFGEHSPLFDTKEEADAYAALLQHRQGMEG